jgi:hypothetical protein
MAKVELEKLSEKGNEQRSDPLFSCIRSAKRTEKYGFGLPQGYAVGASEAFRTVSRRCVLGSSLPASNAKQ